MTKMAFEFNDLKGFMFLVLLTVPFASSTNINCRDKPFHCLNSTHFMMCVDLGGGVSSTIDDFVIQCPPTTVCDANNKFECEFPKFEEPLYVIGVSKVNDNTALPPLIDTSTSMPIATADVKAPIEKNTETVLSHQEPITDPWPEDVLEDLKEEFSGSKEKFFDIPVIVETSTVRYSTEAILTTNPNPIERNTTDQYILKTTPILNPSTVFALEIEINNTTVIDNTRHINNETTMLPENINFNVSSNETHKEGSNFTSNVQQIIINNTHFQTEHTVKKINVTISNTTFFDGLSDLTPKNINEEKIFTETRHGLYERPLQISSSTLLPQINTVQIELAKPPDTTPSKQLDVLPHDTNLTTEATLFRIDSGLETSPKHGELVTVVNNSLTQTLQDANTLDNNVAPATEVTGKVSGLVDNTSPKFSKDIKVSALSLLPEGVEAFIDINSPLPNSTVQLNNKLLTTERNMDGSSSLPVENIEITTRKVPYINQVIDQPGLLSSVAEKEVTNNTVSTDLPSYQVQEHKLISQGYNFSEPVKNVTIDNTNTTYSSTNQDKELHLELRSLSIEAKDEVINKTTITENNVGLNPLSAKEDIDTKNSMISLSINHSLTNRYDGLNTSTFVKKSEAINKTDTPGNLGVDSSLIMTKTADNFTTAMSLTEVSATDAPQVIMPDNTDILSKDIHFNKTSNEIGKELTSRIQPKTINIAIVQGGHNNHSVNDMSRNIANTTVITSETIPYSDNVDNKIKIPDDTNLNLDMNLGNALPSDISTAILSENVSKVIIDSGNNTKHLITTLSPTGSETSQDKDNNTINVANVNVTIEKEIKYIISPSIQSNNVSKEYPTKENNQEMLPTAFDISVGNKIDAGNEEPSRLNFSNKLSNNSRKFLVDKVVETEYSTIPNFVTPASEATREADNILGLSSKAEVTYATDISDKQTGGTEPTIIQNYDTNITETKPQDIDNIDILTPVSSDHNIIRTTLKTNNASDIYSNDMLQVESPLGISLSVKENVSDIIRATTASMELRHVQKYSTKEDNVQSKSTSTLLSNIILEAMDLTTKASVNSKIDDSNIISDTVDSTKIFVDEYHTDGNVNKNSYLTTELIETNKSNVINTKAPNIDRQHQITAKDSTKPEPTIRTENILVHNNTLKSGSKSTLKPNFVAETNIDQFNSQVPPGKLNDTNPITTEMSIARSTNYMINDSNKTVMQIKSELNSTIESIRFDVHATTDMPIVSNINVTTTNSLSSIAFATESLEVKGNITAVTPSNNMNDAVAESNKVSTEQSNINVFIVKTTKPNIQINTTENPSYASAVISELKNNTKVENTGADKTKTSNVYFTMPATFASKDENVKITKPTDDTLLIMKSQVSDDVSITTDMPYTFDGNASDKSIKTEDFEPEKKIDKPILTVNSSKNNSNQNDLSITNNLKKQMDSKLDHVLITKTSEDIHPANTVLENNNRLKEKEITTNSKKNIKMEVPITQRPISESPLLITEWSYIESTPLPIEKMTTYSKTLTLPTVTETTIAKQITAAPVPLEPTRQLKDSIKMNAAQTSLINRSTVIHNSVLNNTHITEPPSIVETINSNNFKYVKEHILEDMKSGNIVNNSTQQTNNSNSQNLIGEAEVAVINQNVTLASERQGNPSKLSIGEHLYLENKNTSITSTTTNININIDNIDKNNTSSSTPDNGNVAKGDKTSSSPALIPSINIAKSVNSNGSAAVEAALKIPHQTHIDKSTNKSLSNLWLLKNTTTNESKPVINVLDTYKVKNNSGDEPNISQTNTKANNLTNHNMNNDTNTGTKKELSNSLINNQIKQNNSEPVFDCSTHPRGKYADSKDCRKFYTCFGIIKPTIGICPNHTVFSEINKQCTRNLSHCVRNNQFRCMYGGRFSDYLKDNIYYICVKNGQHGFLRYTLQCHSSYHLNKASVKCEENEKEGSQSASSAASGGETSALNEDKSSIEPKDDIKSKDDDKSVKTNDECKKEGKFPYPKDCRKYYVCSKNRKDEYRRKIKKCSSDEVYDREDKKCVSADSAEC